MGKRNYFKEFSVLHNVLAMTYYDLGWQYAATISGGTIYLSFGHDTCEVINETGLGSWPRRENGVKLYSYAITTDPYCKSNQIPGRESITKAKRRRKTDILHNPFVFKLYRKRDVEKLEQIYILAQRKTMDNREEDTVDYDYEDGENACLE